MGLSYIMAALPFSYREEIEIPDDLARPTTRH